MQTSKQILIDIGLCNCVQGIKTISLEDLQKPEFVNQGPMAEQFIGLPLSNNNKDKQELHYWIREGMAGNAEVDYLIESGREIISIEIKSGSSGRLKSLHQFCYLKNGIWLCGLT